MKHAQDIRVVYEERLTAANRLYKDLRTCQNHLDAKEMELQR